MNETQAISALRDLCFQHADTRTRELQGRGHKLAHYTSAENGVNILRGKTLWLRNAALMNDFSEIAYGHHCIAHCFGNTDLGKRLHDAVDPAHPGLIGEVWQWLANAESNARLHTYMASVCEHGAEDSFGRLSMWRAYGGDKAGVALVFNTDFLDADPTTLDTYTSPVLYADEHGFADEFEKLVRNLEQNRELLAQVPADNARSIIFYAMQFAVLSTKHPGFTEEQEWRVIHSPYDGGSAFVLPSAESVAGIPQVVYKLPLQNQDGMNMPEVELPKLLHRVIIGPSAYPNQIAEAYYEVLRALGIEDARARISVSHIPLRRVG